jgi:hypothetical protein
MHPLGQSAIRWWHLGDLREQLAFAVLLGRAPAGGFHFPGACLDRCAFLGSEYLGIASGSALGGLLSVGHCSTPRSHDENTSMKVTDAAAR